MSELLMVTCLAYSYTLKMEAIYLSATLAKNVDFKDKLLTRVVAMSVSGIGTNIVFPVSLDQWSSTQGRQRQLRGTRMGM
jgi:hypothetical protein